MLVSCVYDSDVIKQTFGANRAALPGGGGDGAAVWSDPTRGIQKPRTVGGRRLPP